MDNEELCNRLLDEAYASKFDEEVNRYQDIVESTANSVINAAVSYEKCIANEDFESAQKLENRLDSLTSILGIPLGEISEDICALAAKKANVAHLRVEKIYSFLDQFKQYHNNNDSKNANNALKVAQDLAKTMEIDMAAFRGKVKHILQEKSLNKSD